MVINSQFDYAYAFTENELAKVRVGDKYGFIDKTGNLVINPQFEYATDFYNDGYAVISNDGKYGIIDTKGNYIVSAQYNDIDDVDIYVI